MAHGALGPASSPHPTRPVTSPTEIAARVRDAAEHSTRLRISARGHWLSANRPVRADDTLSLHDLTGIVEYVPGDLTITVRAGTSLAEIGAAAHAHGQWLPLDPCGTDDGSIGATVATASAGPHATAFGTPRDQLLGVEFVTGAGDVVRGGGRVVKNVAGFDLVRLSTGAWGTLGVITEVTLRLRSLPVGRETLVLATSDTEQDIERLCAGLRSLATTPLACEVVNAALAERLGLAGTPALLIRIGGNAELMRAQRGALANLGAGAFRAADDEIWRWLRAAESPGDAVWRVSHRASRFTEAWTVARDSVTADEEGWMHGSPLRGVVRCGVAAPDDAPLRERLARFLARPFTGSRIAERLPESAWSAFPSPVMDRVSRGIRDAFDPQGILNTGIMGTSR